VVDFTNTIIIMTSNLGSELLLNAQTFAEAKEAVEGVISKAFKPEFINRIDEIIVFHRLEREQIRRIVELQLALLKGRLALRSLKLEWDSGALDVLAEAGYNPIYGARPVKRAIQDLIENQLATQILAGEFSDGDTILASKGEGNTIALTRRTS
jgi:ATP-dependent Clp protease ATP-binding subunit ClpB